MSDDWLPDGPHTIVGDEIIAARDEDVRADGGEPTEEIELYRCTECGKLSVDLGWLHGHVESHRGYTRLGIQLPFTRTAPADFDALMEYTEVLQVTDYEILDEPSPQDGPGLLARLLTGGGST